MDPVTAIGGTIVGGVVGVVGAVLKYRSEDRASRSQDLAKWQESIFRDMRGLFEIAEARARIAEERYKEADERHSECIGEKAGLMARIMDLESQVSEMRRLREQDHEDHETKITALLREIEALRSRVQTVEDSDSFPPDTGEKVLEYLRSHPAPSDRESARIAALLERTLEEDLDR